MKLSAGPFLAFTLKVIIVGACCLGMWFSWKLALADHLFQQDTEASLRSAIRMAPDAPDYYMRLAQIDRAHAPELLEATLRLNRYNAEADIELGLQYEAGGNYVQAEQFMLQAFDVDRTYVPRWSLANYYLRRDNIPAFWTWAHRAAEMPGGDMGPLFELCWRVTPDPGKIETAILSDQPALIKQYVTFLVGKNQLRAAASAGSRLIRYGEPSSDLPLMFSVVDGLVAARDGDAADALWHLLIERNWIVADAAVPNNASFARAPVPVSFDWKLPSYPGLHSWPGPAGLEAEFTGEQPEDCSIADQVLVLKPGNYTMKYSYRTANIAPDTGIRWQLIDARSNKIIADSPDLSSDAMKQEGLTFSVGPDSSILHLRLAYRRTPGTPRISGTLMMRSIEIRARSQASP
jgi:tetratricopeptide (TPR) repeat protein